MSNYMKIKHYFDVGIYAEKHINALFSAGAISAEERDLILAKGE